jgi:hypothetical protein
MDALHEIDNETPAANVDVDLRSKARPRTHLHPRVFGELSTYSPTARLVGAGEVVEDKSFEITANLQFTLPRSFRSATDCRRFRVAAYGGVLEFYCLD